MEDVTRTPTAKSVMVKALQDLPDDATLDDAIEQLCFLAKIERGLDQSEAGKTVAHQELKARFLK